jgi:trehalose/maltose hydrolase-like predicted phosphorylase
MGSLWQALVFGFAGVRARSDGLSLDPHVPESWEALEVPISYRGNRIRLRMGPDALRIEAERPLVIRLPGAPPMHVAGPLRCRRSGGIWREVRR